MTATLTQFKDAGVGLFVCRDAVVPEIPYVQDVLFAMRLTAEQKFYDFSVSNHATYIRNVALVVAAVAYDVLCMEGGYDEVKARQIIGRAIVELTAPDDRCLFNSALYKAMEAAERSTRLVPADDRDQLLEACGCRDCCEMIAVS